MLNTKSKQRAKLQSPIMRASFSQCGTYRYSLTRKWSSRGTLVVVGLNPSTADGYNDDPTIRRCVGFAKSWGFGHLVMINLFAYRSTDPSLLKKVDDPIGPSNDRFIKRLASAADCVLVAWGNRGAMLGRHEQVLSWLARPYCLGVTGDGFPRHPLYVRADVRPVPFA